MGIPSLPTAFLSISLVNLSLSICLEKKLVKESDF